MKPGFSIFEFVIGMLIGTMLLTQAFVVYNSIAKSTQIVQKYTTMDTKILILQNRLQRDFIGLCPLWFTKKFSKSKEDNPKQDNQEDEKEKKDTPDDIVKNKFFYSQNNNTDQSNLQMFTFVTTNAMQTYGSDNKRLTRVIYSLQPDQKTPPSFTLMRKEINDISIEFDPTQLSQPAGFIPITHNIKSCSMEYGYIQHPETENKQEETPKKEKRPSSADSQEIKIKWSKDWIEKKENKDKNKEEKKPPTPDYVKMKLSLLYNNDKVQEYELYFTIPINTTITFSSAQPEKKQNDKNAQGNKPATPGTTGTPAPLGPGTPQQLGGKPNATT